MPSRPGSTRILRALRLGGCVAALVVALPPAASWAHPFVDDRLVLLDEQIAADPANARLRLSRGSLLLDERHAAEALSEFERALALDPSLAIAHLLRAQALLVEGRIEPAVASARKYLELEPESAKGWRTMARIREAESGGGRGPALDEALNCFDRYFAVAGDPRPDDFLERATLQRRAGRFDDAVNGLEAGIARLGPLTVFLRTALEIERERGRIDAALGYADRLALTSPQEERWQLERARLLIDLGRKDEALSALHRAEAALADRSAARRAAPALSELSREIERLKSELATPSDPGGAARSRP